MEIAAGQSVENRPRDVLVARRVLYRGGSSPSERELLGFQPGWKRPGVRGAAAGLGTSGISSDGAGHRAAQLRNGPGELPGRAPSAGGVWARPGRGCRRHGRVDVAGPAPAAAARPSRSPSDRRGSKPDVPAGFDPVVGVEDEVAAVDVAVVEPGVGRAARQPRVWRRAALPLAALSAYFGPALPRARTPPCRCGRGLQSTFTTRLGASLYFLAALSTSLPAVLATGSASL